MTNEIAPPKTVYIYTLSCPKTGNVRYVGASVNPAKRLTIHKRDAKRHNSSPNHKWIVSLLDERLSPIIDIVDSGDSDTWESKEKYWIQWHKDAGCNLTNQTSGGLNCTFGEDIRRKQSKSHYGKPLSEDSRRKLSEMQLHKRQVIQYTRNGEFIRKWDSINEASRILKINRSSIRACCRGKQKSTNDCIWRYADDSLPE